MIQYIGRIRTMYPWCKLTIPHDWVKAYWWDKMYPIEDEE